MYYTKVSIIFESIYYESTTTTVRVLPADVPSYFPKVRMYNYFISYENTFESNVVHLYSVHIPSYNLLYFRIPSHLVLIRLVVMARAGGWLYPTNLDGTPGDDVEAPFVTWSMSFKPLCRSRPPINPIRTSPTDRRPKRRRRWCVFSGHPKYRVLEYTVFRVPLYSLS